MTSVNLFGHDIDGFMMSDGCIYQIVDVDEKTITILPYQRTSGTSSGTVEIGNASATKSSYAFWYVATGTQTEVQP